MAESVEQMVPKFRAVLEQTERLPPRKLREYQADLLTQLVLHASRHVPYYRDRLTPLLRGDAVDLALWHQVPILPRAQAQRDPEALTATTLPPHAGPVESGETSGSTGRPLQYRINRLAYVATLGATDRALRWWEFDGNKTMASFVGRGNDRTRPPDGTTEQGWRVGFHGLHHMIDNSADTDTRIEWLLARRPHYLSGYSFALLELAERARARGSDLRFERIISLGTALSNDIRTVCKDVLGVSPIDHYGTNEIGLIACECPWCGHYHLNAETLLVEVLGDDGKPCAPGEIGRVVATSFYNYAMPFIRYEVGDFAVAGPARVKCAVKLPALTRIMGRYRNTFILRDGRTLYPYVAPARFREFMSFDQIQIVQTDYEEIEVRYVPLDTSREVDAAGLEACLRAEIDASFNVRAVPVEEVPRSASGKFEDYLSLVSRRGGGL
jgi:phenylacetate-CoA ligase